MISGCRRSALAGLSWLALCSVASAAELTGAEIRAELIGRQIAWWQSGGWQNGVLTLRPQGSARLTVEGPARASDQGRWVLRGDRLCTEWRMLRSARQECYGLTRSAPGRFITSSGNIFELRDAGA